MAQPNIADLNDEKPLEGVGPRAQDSPTPQSVGTKYAGTEAPRTTTQRVFQPRNRARNQAFAARLRDAMNRGGLHSSEVARRVWGTARDKRGHNVARSRDRIGHYLNGVSYPSPEIMARLAAAVGLSVEELAGEPAADPARSRPQGSSAKHPAVAGASGDLILTSLPAQPTKIRIQVDRVIHWKLAASIHAMLKEAETGEKAATDESVEDDGLQPGDLIQGGLASQ